MRKKALTSNNTSLNSNKMSVQTMYFKLINAEEVIAQVTGKTGSHLKIQNPVRVLCSANIDGTLSTLFIPWNLLGQFDELLLETDKVVIMMPASKKATKLYDQYWKAQKKKEEFMSQTPREKVMAYDLMLIESGGRLVKH